MYQDFLCHTKVDTPMVPQNKYIASITFTPSGRNSDRKARCADFWANTLETAGSDTSHAAVEMLRSS